MRALALLSILFLLPLAPLVSSADINLDTPEKLIERASEGKNQLRDVINEIDLNLSEIRDVRTFDRYFFLLDDLQELATKFNLDSIYPDAVKKLGHRMVTKGVNWVDVVSTPTETVLYYHRWMQETQPAFAFLYAADLRRKEETDYGNLKKAAITLEATLLFAEKKWESERPLRLLYRSTLSTLAAQMMKRDDLAESEVDFWISKIYSAEAMGELVTFIQSSVYDVKPETVQKLHWALRRLLVVHQQSTNPAFGAPENLISQINDTAVDIVLKSFRFEEKLSDDEFTQSLGAMRLRHYAALANAWASIGKVPRGDFGTYYIKRAFSFIAKLDSLGLSAESTLLSTAITAKAAAILGRSMNIEGTWTMKDRQNKTWRLVIAFASEDLVFASFTDGERITSRPFFHVVYDVHMGNFLATERAGDTDLSPNLPLRFEPQDDGTMLVEDLMFPENPKMLARRSQTYPDLMNKGAVPGPNMNGSYEGEITIPGGTKTPVVLVVTVFDGYSIGNMRFLGSNTTFNYGSPANDGSIYLTRGSTSYRGTGTWMQLRGTLGRDGYLRGYSIVGNWGMVEAPFALKKVK